MVAPGTVLLLRIQWLLLSFLHYFCMLEMLLRVSLLECSKVLHLVAVFPPLQRAPKLGAARSAGGLGLPGLGRDVRRNIIRAASLV